jgi:AraC family transcriptional regulator
MQVKRHATQRKHRQTLLPILVHIEEHLDDDLSLSRLAALAGFSPHHFHRVFHHITGETPREYVRRLRLERAVYRLKVSPDNVLDIALQAGFQTHESFTRAFTQQFDMNPSELRALLRQFRDCVDEALGTYTFDGFSLDSPLKLRKERRVEPITLATLPEQPVIFKRYYGPYEELLRDDQSFADLWAELLDNAAAAGMDSAEPRLIGICHDDPYVTEPAKLRFDACLAVEGPLEVRHPIGYRALPGGLCVGRRHYNGFEEITKTFAFIGVEWLPTENYLLRTAPPFEVYHCQMIDGHLERIYTDAYVPLEPLKSR